MQPFIPQKPTASYGGIKATSEDTAVNWCEEVRIGRFPRSPDFWVDGINMWHYAVLTINQS